MAVEDVRGKVSRVQLAPRHVHTCAHGSSSVTVLSPQVPCNWATSVWMEKAPLWRSMPRFPRACLPQGVCPVGVKGHRSQGRSSPQDQEGWGVRSALVLRSTGQADGCSRRFPGQRGRGPAPQETQCTRTHLPHFSPADPWGSTSSSRPPAVTDSPQGTWTEKQAGAGLRPHPQSSR